MSVPNRRKKHRRSETSALQILEEAFHLLRTVDARAWIWFFGGAVPFVLMMLYFTADMSRSGTADRTAFFVAAMATGFYFWHRFCQAKFCAALWNTINPGHLPRRTVGERFRNLAALFFLHALYAPLLLIGIFFAIPLGWILAMQQNFTILAATQDYGDRPLRRLFETSVRHSHHEWAQNHGVLLILAVVSFFTWVNIVATCVVLAGFVKAFFGAESVFTVSPTAAVMNSTFLLGSFLLTYLVISPTAKAAYTLRCFYAESCRTGADLLSRLAACRLDQEESDLQQAKAAPVRKPAYPRTVAMLLATMFLLFPWESGTAAEMPAPSGNTGSEQLRDSIGETLEQKKYQWQFSRRLEESESEAELGWLARRIDEIAKATREAFRSFAEWLQKLGKKMSGRQTPRPQGGNVDVGWFRDLGSLLSVGLVVLVGGLVLWLGWLLYRRTQAKDDPEEVDDGSSAVVDLRSEEIVADQLPEQEWMRLAREQISQGDGRLAVRALFLATLARLGEEGVLRIEKYKSNRDYRDELARKARRAEQLRSAFDANARIFERSWYGWHPVSDQMVESYLENHEVIGNEAASAIRGRRAPEVATKA